MAEAFLNAMRPDSFIAYSAGTDPKGVDPMAIEVMGEIGIDISGNRAKEIHEFNDMEFDYVITLCDKAKDSCPFFPAKKKVLHKAFDDPPELARGLSREEALGIYRRVRDEIQEFVKHIDKHLS